MKEKIVLLILLSIFLNSCTIAQTKKKTKTAQQSSAFVKKNAATEINPIVTFVELGSVNCIPCKAMQKVMKAVEEKYGSQLKIIFYDVWKQEQAHFAEEYKIRLIPTQVFLDVNGKELMRHEGYYPENEIDAFLQSKGLKPKLSARE